jgi:hypothetical protein
MHKAFATAAMVLATVAAVGFCPPPAKPYRVN